MPAPTPEREISNLFAGVDSDWDLPALYDDLEDIKRSCLTEKEKMCVRGLLHYGSRTKLTEKLGADTVKFREYLHQNVYTLIGVLVGCPDGEVASSRISQWLEEKGYRKSAPTEPVATPPSGLSPHIKKIAIGGVGLALTIATGVVVEVLTGVFTDAFTGGDDPPIVTDGQNGKGSLSFDIKAETFSKVSVPSGIFNYGGSTSWAVLRAEVDPTIQAAHPDFQLRYVNPIADAPGSETGIKMLLNDQLSFAQSSRPIKDEEYRHAKERGFELRAVPVAIDGIAIAVHPKLDVAGITVAQLREIYLGNITNWKDVGGPDLNILPLSRPLEAGGTVDFFVKNVLGKSFSPTVKTVASTSLALREASNNPGAIYYASAPSIVSQCTVKALAIGRKANALVSVYQEPYIPPSDCPAKRNKLNVEVFQQGAYPITRRMFVILKESDRMDREAGAAYARLMLSREGQNAVEKAGFVPIR